MKNFHWKKYVYAVLAVYVAYQFLDFLIHGVILGPTYTDLADTGLWRENMESTMWIMYVTGLFFTLFFVYLFHYFVQAYGKSGWFAGLYFGLVVAFLVMVTGMFNQYAVYNVTLSLTWQWFIFGVIEVTLLGILAGLVYKPLPPK